MPVRLAVVDTPKPFPIWRAWRSWGVHSEKLALIYVTLKNVDSDAEGVMLTDLFLASGNERNAR